MHAECGTGTRDVKHITEIVQHTDVTAHFFLEVGYTELSFAALQVSVHG